MPSHWNLLAKAPLVHPRFSDEPSSSGLSLRHHVGIFRVKCSQCTLGHLMNQVHQACLYAASHRNILDEIQLVRPRSSDELSSSGSSLCGLHRNLLGETNLVRPGSSDELGPSGLSLCHLHKNIVGETQLVHPRSSGEPSPYAFMQESYG